MNNLIDLFDAKSLLLKQIEVHRRSVARASDAERIVCQARLNAAEAELRGLTGKFNILTLNLPAESSQADRSILYA